MLMGVISENDRLTMQEKEGRIAGVLIQDR